MCIAKVFKLFLLRNSNKKFDVKKVDKIPNKCKFPYSNMFCSEPNRGWIKSIKSSSTLVQWDEKQMKAFIGCQQQHSRVQMKRGENRVVKPNVQLQNLLNANLGFKIHLFRYLSEIALNLRAWRRGKKLDELFITATFASVFMALMAFLFVCIHTYDHSEELEWILFTCRFICSNPLCRRRSIFLMFVWFVMLHSIAA